MDGRDMLRGFDVSLVNCFAAHKQHLLPGSRADNVVQVVRDIAALHATVATGPYLSLWARMPHFRQQDLDGALYDRRELVRLLCMRNTLHIVPSDEVSFFVQAYAKRRARAEARRSEKLLVQAGLCDAPSAASKLTELREQVLEALAGREPATVQEISQAVPELQAKIRHDVGKPYEGEFSVGSRLVPSLCTLGLLVRVRPRGSWRSNLYDYAALSDWLPEVDLASVAPLEARAWLVRRYISAFGPVRADDVQWWTGLNKGETAGALRLCEGDLVEVGLAGHEGTHLMLARDARALREYVPPETCPVFFLPGLDPYIMGYQDRRRFLAEEHNPRVFDRAGNAMPTVWVNGRVVGAWGQRKDGSVVHALFEAVPDEAPALLAAEAQRLEAFLDGEFLPQRSHTTFTRSLK